MPIRKIQNPVPFFEEAADAAQRYMAAKREHLILTAEIRAKREGKRAAYGVASLVVASLGLFLCLFWITLQIHEAGMASWAVALVSLGLLGSIAGILALIASRPVPSESGHPRNDHNLSLPASSNSSNDQSSGRRVA